MQINSVDSCSHDVVIRVYHNAGNVIEVHEKPGEFKEWRAHFFEAKASHLWLKRGIWVEDRSIIFSVGIASLGLQ
jgi:hypothetical protein